MLGLTIKGKKGILRKQRDFGMGNVELGRRNEEKRKKRLKADWQRA
jgi:hypothetical protein